jgi:hypothetical protein
VGVSLGIMVRQGLIAGSFLSQYTSGVSLIVRKYKNLMTVVRVGEES